MWFIWSLSFTDQGSTYSGDLESEAVSTPHSWEDELNHYALRSNALPEPDPEVKQFSKGDVEQDLEADFPSGLYNVKKMHQCIKVHTTFWVSIVAVVCFWRVYFSFSKTGYLKQQ